MSKLNAIKRKAPAEKRFKNNASSFVTCPACQEHVAKKLINLHLDSDCMSLTPQKRPRKTESRKLQQLYSGDGLKEIPSIECSTQFIKELRPQIQNETLKTESTELKEMPSLLNDNETGNFEKPLWLFRPPPISEMKGYRLIEDFISLEEEEHLLSCLSMDQRNPWKISVFSGFTRNKSYGLIAAFSKRQVLPEKFAIPKFLEPVIERMRSITELANFHPNELNSLEYIKEEGHFLRPHVDDRQLSGELIVNLSLCGDCYMTFQRERGVYERHRIRLKRRSLQILSGDSRYNFTHAITNEDLLSPRRVSVTFREVRLTC